MDKQEIRLFFASFAITLLFFGFIGAFILVDASAARRERGSDETIFSIAPSGEDRWKVAVFGRESELSVQPLRQMSAFYADYAPLLMPRGIYAAGSLWDYGVFWGNEFYEKYKEDIFLQEVGGQPEQAPLVASNETDPEK